MPDIQNTSTDTEQTTGANATSASQPQTQQQTGNSQNADRGPLRDQPLETQVEVWKELSTKHENQSKANYKRIQELTEQLNSERTEKDGVIQELRMENARYRVRAAHPEVTDAQLALCDKTDPEEYCKWFDQLMNAFPERAVTAQTDSKLPTDAELASRTARLSVNPGGKPKIAVGSEADGRARFARMRGKTA